MRYLKLKRRNTRKNSAGQPIIEPLIVTKPRKFAKATREQSISKTKHVLITGGHDAGKSRWLMRLHNEAKDIWRRYPDDPLLLDPIRPLSAWGETKQLQQWWKQKQRDNQELPPWKALKAYERQDLIADYLSEKKALLFIDNAHKLTGRKQQIAKEALTACKLSVVTTTDEERLPASIRGLVLRRQPQAVRLGTETAYDATTMLVFIFTMASIAAGWWEVALVTGGLTAVSKGARSTRQD